MIIDLLQKARTAMTAKLHVMLVDDEQDIRRLLKFHLEKAGYAVTTAKTAEETLKLLKTNKPDLLLLDLMLPGMSGTEACRKIKENPDTAKIPIIMLTAKNKDNDVVAGLEMGAADYITKPFSPQVLIARIQAVLRHLASVSDDHPAQPVLTAGPLVIDPDRHKVEIKGKPVALTYTEFRILQFLVEHPGRAFTRQQIIDQIHNESYVVTERIVDVQMVGLRKKLGLLGDWIETVRKVGYRFREV